MSAFSMHAQFRPQLLAHASAQSPLTPKLQNPIAASESPLSEIEGASQAGSAVAGVKRAGTDSLHDDGQSSKPKQKRNKPTLSCEECVERKTKVRICCAQFDVNVCGSDNVYSVTEEDPDALLV